jgi:hypothetical protein
MSVSQTIDGNTLIAWGFRPGRWFKDALESANTMRAGGADDDAIFVALQVLQPVETLMRTNGLQFSMLIDAENELERARLASLPTAPVATSGARLSCARTSLGCRPASMPVSTAVRPTCRNCRRLTRTPHRYDRRSRDTASGR